MQRQAIRRDPVYERTKNEPVDEDLIRLARDLALPTFRQHNPEVPSQTAELRGIQRNPAEPSGTQWNLAEPSRTPENLVEPSRYY